MRKISALTWESFDWDYQQEYYGPIVNYGWYVYGQPQKVSPSYNSTNTHQWLDDVVIPSPTVTTWHTQNADL